MITDLLHKLGFNLLLLAKILLIMAAAFVLERLIRILLKRAYLRSEGGNEDRTRYRFLRNGVRFIVSLIAIAAIIYTIPAFKHLALTLFAGAGILVAVIGFAAQGAFSNIISGIFIVSFKPFRVGDMIKVGELHVGVVEDITLRHTVLVSFENRRVIIPNAIIGDATIVNSSIGDEATCEFVELGIGYESDLDKAMAIVREEAERHPDCIDRRTETEKKQGVHKVLVRLVTIADSSLILRAYVWGKDPITSRRTHYDLNRSLKLRFDKEGIVMPYPQRTVTFNGPISVRHITDEKGR
ncbi:MAG: mechanosensitive ion channel family protein [Flavobacteriales bacterium]|nr:mechanosensitive ion channel family protein [Flavobacteriales bacterium]MCC6938846.1 mechanosensitive ion channel family protein [Flavobacteriales bacterium]